MHFLKSYLKQRRKVIFLFLLFCLVFVCALVMYRLPLEAALYPAGVCAFLGLAFLALDMQKVWCRCRRLKELEGLPAELQGDFPQAGSLEDEGYQQIIRRLCEEQKQAERQMDARYSDMIDYYTVWAHQIKTPIASMRLNLQNQDSEFARRILEDLLRIEQYVEMVLCYLRLDSDSTDYLIREYDLDGIVKQAVKKFSAQFIRKKIKLCYRPLDARVVTDEKWLQFVLEQVISNALKYTESGKITIELEGGAWEEGAESFVQNGGKAQGQAGALGQKKKAVLCIRDTGIGIASEDLPRIFEKGYTGYNGRNDKKASGIGLYLCRRVCRNLRHTITANSSLESGTVIRIGFGQDRGAVPKQGTEYQIFGKSDYKTGI